MTVISPRFDGNYTTVYAYDLNSRLEKEVKTIDDQVTKRTETANYFYDPNGNQISKLNEQSDAMFRYGMLSINVLGMDFTPNDDGYGENDGEFIPSAELYVYDVFNRLIETEMQGYTIRYGYKADGMRLHKEINGNKTTHVWDGSNIVLEMNGSNGIIGRYIRGINLIKDTVNYFAYNAHGDVVQLTDGLGAVTKNYRYDAFGVETNIDKQDTNVWRYCGEYFDKETGTIYLRHRNYDSFTGRFSSEDPVRDGLNWYIYGNGNPLYYIDPWGLAPLRDYTNTKNGTIEWNAKTATATVTIDGITASFTQGVDGVYIDKNGKMHVDDSALAKIFENNRANIVVIHIGISTTMTLPITMPFPLTIPQIPFYPMPPISIPLDEMMRPDNYIPTIDGNRTADDILKEKKGSVRNEFPSEWLNKPFKEIEAAARRGEKTAQKAKKLLENKRFDKGSNYSGKKK